MPAGRAFTPPSPHFLESSDLAPPHSFTGQKHILQRRRQATPTTTSSRFAMIQCMSYPSPHWILSVCQILLVANPFGAIGSVCADISAQLDETLVTRQDVRMRNDDCKKRAGLTLCPRCEPVNLRSRSTIIWSHASRLYRGGYSVSTENVTGCWESRRHARTGRRGRGGRRRWGTVTHLAVVGCALGHGE